MIRFIFTQHAKKAYLKLPLLIQKRILTKLNELKHHEDVFSVIKRLSDFKSATHRLRVGTYRLLLYLDQIDSDDIDFRVVDVADWKDVYR